MAKKSKARTDPGEDPGPEPVDVGTRNDQLIKSETDPLREDVLDILKDIEKGFQDQSQRSDDILDYWDCYNCELSDQQFYNGNSKIFVPIVYNAVNARKTRFVNQLFPMTGRYVEVTTEDGTIPHSEMALLEHYVRHAKLRTQIAPALMKNADVEGQMTVHVEWRETKRHVVHRVQAPPKTPDGMSMGKADEPIEDVEEEEIKQGGPLITVIPDCDLCVLPATADSLEDALANGGSVTTIVRWSKAKLARMIALEEVDEAVGRQLMEEMKQSDKSERPDKAKEMVDAAGIRSDGRGKFVQLYRTWTMLTIEDERRLCLIYYGGKDRVLSCKRNPNWSDRIDVISAPTEKVDGSFKGVSKVKQVLDLQLQANDAINEGMDSAAYALMPIVMTDPERNPKVGSMILSLAAVWEVDPNSTKFINFPPIWKDALEIVATAKQEIFQTLSVNPSQITQAMGKNKKPNQAEIANEQQIDILTTADSVTVAEDEIWTPILRFMLELDHQYRDKEITVREYGETGMKMNMRQIPPVQMNQLYQFRWFGVEAARSAQQMQQQIAGLNVIKEIPPQLYPGYKLDLGAVMSQMVENLFGPRLAPLTFKDAREELSVDPVQENEFLKEGFITPVHAMDDHSQHIQAHMALAKETGDPKGVIRVHIMAHMNALQMQQQAQAAKAGEMPQQPGGGGGPRPGAAPGAQRNAQQPPGAIHQDRMKDPSAAPRAQ